MTHYMHLEDKPFRKIALGRKTIELRLYDEKRREIDIDDEIVFVNLSTSEQSIIATVDALHVFTSFAELYSSLPLERCGYSLEELASAKPEDMERYYSKEEQAQYGVVGIEVYVEEVIGLSE